MLRRIPTDSSSFSSRDLGGAPKAFTGAQGGPAPLSDEAQPSSTRCRPRVSTDLLPGAGQPQGTQASAGRSQSQDGTAPASRHKHLRDEAPGHLSWARPVHHLASAPMGGRATSPWTTEALRPRCPPAPGPRAGSRAGSATDLCASPLVASSIMMTTSAVRATAITCRPRPFPGQGGEVVMQ